MILHKVYQYSAGIFYRKYKSLGGKFYYFGELDAHIIIQARRSGHYGT